MMTPNNVCAANSDVKLVMEHDGRPDAFRKIVERYHRWSARLPTTPNGQPGPWRGSPGTFVAVEAVSELREPAQLRACYAITRFLVCKPTPRQGAANSRATVEAIMIALIRSVAGGAIRQP